MHRFVGQGHVWRVTVRIAENSNGPVTEVASRADHAAGNLPAIGNQNFVKHKAPLRESGWQSVLRR
jgi:hypothetical protein